VQTTLLQGHAGTTIYAAESDGSRRSASRRCGLADSYGEPMSARRRSTRKVRNIAWALLPYALLWWALYLFRPGTLPLIVAILMTILAAGCFIRLQVVTTEQRMGDDDSPSPP
jgi:hypothetical protein